MFRQALVFPVPAARSDAEVRQIADYFSQHPAEYRQSRDRLGVTLERAYLQKTPAGSAVVAYVESETSFGEVIGQMLASPLELDRRFIELVAEIHLIDLRQPLAGPPPGTIGEWTDPAVTTRARGLAFAAPVLPGRTAAGVAHIRTAFGERRAEFTESRRALHDSVEVVTLNPTPAGDVAAVYIEGSDPVEANRRFAASRTPFDVWFKDGLKDVLPIGLDEPLPPIEEFFDSLALAVRA